MANVAILLGPEFEDAEFKIPYDRLRKAGHHVEILGTERGEKLRGKRGKEKAKADAPVAECDPTYFHAVVIPGGHSPDHLRIHEPMVKFLRRFGETGRPIAAVCHGPQLLIEADLVEGKRMTSWPSVRKDLENAGVQWVNEQVVLDQQFITARKPEDLEAFSNAILEKLE